ncbi:hypothetical protein AK812_SmicGene17160 [Symbiodinium microadriaticum]|uniref:Uncharacterized protein n=1 Tax=Symbiodinium microadriaticum TaxID=2951 RepID=A0A1Q9DYJ5_SYMMI|nr:hypothetical protein AK812_SmicGene17160 [Symbiodinium microadriaticum]
MRTSLKNTPGAVAADHLGLALSCPLLVHAKTVLHPSLRASSSIVSKSSNEALDTLGVTCACAYALDFTCAACAYALDFTCAACAYALGRTYAACAYALGRTYAACAYALGCTYAAYACLALADWDVSSKPSSVEDEKHVIVTTVGEHKLSKRLGTIPIMFRRTDLFGMEKGANGEDLWFRLKYHSKRSFQLLSLSGEPVQRESAETSHGWIILSAHRSLLHSNTWFGVPVVIIGSLLIICGIPLLLYSSDRLRIPIDPGVVVVTWLITAVLAFGGSQMIKVAQTTRNTISDKIDRFKSKVYRVNPTPHACKRGAERALNINQIVDLYEEFKSFIQDRNLYYVDSNIVRPLTRFVSHYWGTNFSYTVRALKLHANSVPRDSLITQSKITIASDEASKSIATRLLVLADSQGQD